MFMSKQNSSQYITDIEMFLVFVDQQILHIQHADDIVGAFFIDRITGVPAFPVDIHGLPIGCIDIQETHVDFRHHNILCGGISEIEHIVDHFFFFLFDDAIFMAHIDQWNRISSSV